MKNIFTYLITIITILVSINSFAQDRVNRVNRPSKHIFTQDRVNRPKLTFTSESESLTAVTGWVYDHEAGEWVESKNWISPNKRSISYKSNEFVSRYDNNIISLQFKTVTYNNKIYYILVWEKLGGHYIYPEIHEDWIYYKVKKFMVFTEYDMNKLHNLTNDVYELKLYTITKGYNNSNIEDVDVIQTGLNNMEHYLTETRPGLKNLIELDKETIEIYKATDGSIRFVFGNWLHIRDIEYAYFEISEEEYTGLITLK